MIQFMKSKTDRYGEHESFDKLGIEVHTMGDGFTWDNNDKSQDIKTTDETWTPCVDKVRNGDYDVLVIDRAGDHRHAPVGCGLAFAAR